VVLSLPLLHSDELYERKILPVEIPFELADILLVLLVIATGSAIQAAVGMGLNLLAIPLLLLINPVFAPGPVFAASAVLSFLALWRVPAKVDREELKLGFFGLVMGTAFAGALATAIDSESFARLLGLFVILGVGLALSGWSAPINRRNLIVAGGGAGFLGTIAGPHGPPIVLLYQGLEPDRVRGATLTFIGTGNTLSLIALLLIGRFGTEQLMAAIILAPGVLVGLFVAPRLAQLIDARLLRSIVLAISAISGFFLMIG
jgi:uncharacterized membrane protein YfcA